jgi:hypothetical protein
MTSPGSDIFLHGRSANAGLNSGLRVEWLAAIEESIDALAALNVKTEDGFLSVGAQLQTVYTRTMEISDHLTQVMNNFTSERQNRLTEKICEVMKTATRYLGNFDTTSRYVVDRLGSVLQTVDELPVTLKEFDRLVSQLRIMGITTRIETERLGLSNMGFEHLADEVTTLGENISRKAREVQASIRTIFTIVSVNERNLARLRSKHQGLQLSVTKSMNDDLQLLNEKHEVLTNVMENISRQSQDSIHSVNAIVGAIQFHDITRQQIEHVIEALKDLRDHATGGDASDSLSYLIVVCELQPAQLQRARTEFLDAILSLISSFGNLSNTIGMMQAESREAIGFVSGDGSTFFSVIGTNLQNVTMALIEGEKGIHEFLASLEEIDHVVRKMEIFMGEMSEAGDEVKLLALNSRVRAAKTRERGAALGVIAESIQRISTMAEMHIADVVRGIATLVEKTNEIHASARSSEISRTTDSSIVEMRDTLRAMIDEFASTSTLGKNILEQAAATSSILAKELAQMAGMVHDNRIVSERIEHIERLLSSIAAEARTEAPEIVLMAAERRLEEMNERYTMHSERDTHAAYIGGSVGSPRTDAATSGSVELF